MAEQPFIYNRTIQLVNQQTSCTLKASIMEYKKNILDSKASGSTAKQVSNTPNILELVKIVLGTIPEQNARKMTLQERRAFYDITNELMSLTQELR